MTVQPLRSCIYVGRVMHHRLRPMRHRFVYRVFSLLLDLDEIDRLPERVRLLAVERPGILGFRARDHGPRDGRALKPWVLETLERHGIALRTPRILLLCFPRLLGYVFDPISLYFCFDDDGRLRAVVHEVKNTFGEQHCYVLPVPGGAGPGEVCRQSCAKAFYVSPFIEMTARYDFRIRVPDEQLLVTILESVGEGPLLVATHTGERRPLSDRALARCLMGHLLMTLKITAGIHLEALRLWLKGARPAQRWRPAAEASLGADREPA